jgi:hypothetical protein
MHRYVLPGAALAVSSIALFIALSGTGAASGLVGQSSAMKTSSVIRRTLLHMMNGPITHGGTANGVRFVVGHFRKAEPSSIIKVTWTGEIGANHGLSANDYCSFQLQVSELQPDGNGGSAMVTPTTTGHANALVPVGVTATFTNSLGPGRHALSLWIQSKRNRDRCDTDPEREIYGPPGGAHETFLVEEWSALAGSSGFR